MFKRMLMAVGVVSLAGLGACAHVPDNEQEAQASDEEVYCQTDDSTGSRLAPRTVCHSGTDSDAQRMVRDIQNSHQTNPQR